MIPNGRLKIGDVVLYKRKNKIKEWEINSISPSGDYFEIENDDWSERWIHRGNILEIIEHNDGEIEITVSTVSDRPPVIDSKFK